NSYNIRVTVDMTDSRPIIELQKFFGGSIAQVNRKALNRKPTTYWRVSGKLAEKAIRILQPFLLVKVEQAVIALQLRDRINITPRKGREHLSSEELKIRADLKTQIGILNKRGLYV